jgi:hypothetical protein
MIQATKVLKRKIRFNKPKQEVMAEDQAGPGDVKTKRIQ